ncbi:MAG: monovalent cation/H+ antiporter complex subunit F [Bacteroidota bacterium]|nr:monovalent cation/H+ antiporter complex subunit F [Bacteroidota bacterium]
MINKILFVAAIIMLLAILLTLYRFIKGPSAADRLVAFDVMTVSSLALIALIANFASRVIYIDVALVYGLLSFLGVIIVSRYLERGL